MKYLLVAINAKYIHSNLAVYSLLAYTKKYAKLHDDKASQLEIAEYTINQYTDKILQDIFMKKPDVIGFSCYIWNISMIEELLSNISKILPNTDIWVGGPEVSYNATKFLEKHKNVRGVMRGEGEEIFKNVFEIYANEKTNLNREEKLSETKGITYRKNISLNNQDTNSIQVNADQMPIDMSDIPFVYSDLQEFENRIIYYESSRGCPFNCSYCLSSIDKKLRFRDTELVKQELKFFIDNKISQVKFVDRTFNCNHKHAMEILKFIKEHDNGITNFHFEVAADILSEEEINIINSLRPGLVQLEIGVQSTNENTITLIDRKMDFEKVAEVVEKLKQPENVHLHLDLIAGLPEEDLESFERSFNMVYALKPEQLQLGFLKVLHGSKIESQIEENETLYYDTAPYEVLATKWISFDEIIGLKRVEEVLEIYYNSGQFANSIKELEKYFRTPFEMYSKLGDYYYRFSQNGEKHSRIKRYELLLDFFNNNIECTTQENNAFVSLLTLDVYLRENIKNRPSFSNSQDEYKKEIIEFYIAEEENRKYLPSYKEYNSKQLAKMTHIEFFDFNIIEYINSGNYMEEKQMIVFDYENRNPLDYSARIIANISD